MNMIVIEETLLVCGEVVDKVWAIMSPERTLEYMFDLHRELKEEGYLSFGEEMPSSLEMPRREIYSFFLGEMDSGIFISEVFVCELREFIVPEGCTLTIRNGVIHFVEEEK